MQTFYHKIVITCELLILIAVQTIDSDQTLCPNGTTYLESADTENCFALVDVSEGPITNDEAVDKCGRFTKGRLVFVRRKVSMLQ